MFVLKIFCVVLLSISLLLYLSDNQTIAPCCCSYSSTFTVIKRAIPRFGSCLTHLVAALVLPLGFWCLHRLEPLLNSGRWKIEPPVEA